MRSEARRWMTIRGRVKEKHEKNESESFQRVLRGVSSHANSSGLQVKPANMLTLTDSNAHFKQEQYNLNYGLMFASWYLLIRQSTAKPDENVISFAGMWFKLYIFIHFDLIIMLSEKWVSSTLMTATSAALYFKLNIIPVLPDLCINDWSEDLCNT